MGLAPVFTVGFREASLVSFRRVFIAVIIITTPNTMHHPRPKRTNPKRPQLRWRELLIGEIVLLSLSRSSARHACLRWSKKLSRKFILHDEISPGLFEVMRVV